MKKRFIDFYQSWQPKEKYERDKFDHTSLSCLSESLGAVTK